MNAKRRLEIYKAAREIQDKKGMCHSVWLAADKPIPVGIDNLFVTWPELWAIRPRISYMGHDTTVDECFWWDPNDVEYRLKMWDKIISEMEERLKGGKS